MLRARTLRSRLLLSHGALALLVAVSLAVTLQGLLRMVGLVTLMGNEGLAGVDAEEDVHRAAWVVEVSARHGRVQCELGREGEARLGLEDGRQRLRAMLARETVPQGSIREVSTRYLNFVDRALQGDPCAFLARPDTDRERAQLDEDLTNAWVERLRDVHEEMREKENLAKHIGTTATALGFAIAALAAVASFVVARSIAASVNMPIAELARAATRLGELGEGAATPILVSGGPTEVQELARDLERMRRRIEEIDQLKQTFLANVSHELRTPLARLREALSLLSDDSLGEVNARQRRVLDLARRACEEEVRLVSSLLDLSRLRSGQSIQLQERVSLGPVLDAAVASEREAASRRKIDIRGPSSVRATLTADTSLLERAVANLLRNAASVSKSGDVVELDVDVDETKAVVRVRDHGPGVPQGARERLFTPFASAPVPGADRPFSLGLGLAFAREVARAHGGELELTSTDEHGSTFSFVLPLTHAPPLSPPSLEGTP